MSDYEFNIPELRNKDFLEILNDFDNLDLIIKKYVFNSAEPFDFTKLLPFLNYDNIEKLLNKYNNLNIILYQYLHNIGYYDEPLYIILYKYLDIEIMNLSIINNDLSLLNICLSSNIIPNKSTYKLLIENKLFDNILDKKIIDSNIIESIILDYIHENKEDFAYSLIIQYCDKINVQLIFEKSLSFGNIHIIEFLLNNNKVIFDYDLSKIDNSKTIEYIVSLMI